MGLQNAFGDIALDASLQQLIAKVVAIAVEEALKQSIAAPRGLQYARTATDQMRVNVDNTVTTSTTVSNINMWAAGVYAGYYTTGGMQSVDKRQQQAELANSNFLYVRQSRWSIT